MHALARSFTIRLARISPILVLVAAGAIGGVRGG
jgi:hypothetical protein